jgi:hypothetical protein
MAQTVRLWSEVKKEREARARVKAASGRRATKADNFKNQAPNSSSNGVQNLKFERADWTSFRTVEGLQQKAGVAVDKLRRLVLKELVDNALDTGAEVHVGNLPKGGYFVEDKGTGISGTPEEIARLYSIARPLISTKLLRLPTRGALGNGLRVVAGAVLASQGTLTVTTKNRRIKLQPRHDGSTAILSKTTVKFPKGTRIEISFGSPLPKDHAALSWASFAVRMQKAAGRQDYAGKSSPFWYDVPQFTNCCPPAATRRSASLSPILTAALAPALARLLGVLGSPASSAPTSRASRRQNCCRWRGSTPSPSRRTALAPWARKGFSSTPMPRRLAPLNSALPRPMPRFLLWSRLGLSQRSLIRR